MPVSDINPLIEAAKARKMVSLEYEKKTTGEFVNHRGGIYEIGTNKAGAPCLWLWDTDLNTGIRQFLLSNIMSFQVLDIAFDPPQPWPIKINGVEV